MIITAIALFDQVASWIPNRYEVIFSTYRQLIFFVVIQ